MNIPIETIVIKSLAGNYEQIGTKVISEIADYYRKEMGYAIPPNQPLVSSDFGDIFRWTFKDSEIYNIYDTSRLLNRPIGVSVTDKYGTSKSVDIYFNLTEDEKVHKRHERIINIKE